MKKEEKIIMYESEEAAKQMTVTGWVSSTGRFWGKDEHMARYEGSTHKLCECGNLTSKHWTRCETCISKAEIERYNNLPYKDWDGETMLAIYGDNQYFSDEDDILYYMEDNEIESSKDLMLVICEPNYPGSISSSIWDDIIPEEGCDELDKLVNEFNEKLKQLPPTSWRPGKFRTSVSLTAEDI